MLTLFIMDQLSWLIKLRYWCIDDKYRIYVTRLRNGERRDSAG